ncbi:MAG: tetratricopeptide repeat protein [Sphingobacteriales bacterium]|nr:MAG: tetratricopeptide repeat protein [Sphingobacteriales bacterium]
MNSTFRINMIGISSPLLRGGFRWGILLLLFVFQSCKQNSGDKNENFKEQMAEYTESIDKNPNKPQPYIHRAKAYFKTNQLEPAIRDMEKAVSLDTTKADNYLLLAEMYEKRPYVKGVINALEHVIELDPKDKKTALKLGILNFQVKNRDASFKYLNMALRLDPTNAEAFYYRGYNYREVEMPDKAIENFQRAIDLKPDYFDAFLQMGLLHAEKGDIKAEGYYSSALRLQPNNLKALYARGMFYQENDSNQKAIEDFEKILTFDPDFLTTQYNIGYNYFLLKEYQKAIPYLTKAIQLHPENPHPYKTRALCFAAMKRTAEAAEDNKRVQELEK